jgi:hypothetical protein
VAYERRSGDLRTYEDKAPSGHVSAIRGTARSAVARAPSGSKCPADDSSCMYCGKRGHWAGVCRKRQSDNNNSGRSKSSDRGRSRGRSKPRKTDYKKAKERGESYTGKNDRKSDGDASKGARPKQQGRGSVNTSNWSRRRPLTEALPSVNTICEGKEHAEAHRPRQWLRTEDRGLARYRRLLVHHLAELDRGVRPLAQGRHLGSAEAFFSHW